MNRKWLEDWPWESVLAINAALCKQKKALHQPTSEGYQPTQKLWEDSRSRKLPLRTALQVCRQCHKLSPFCFYNGNTFAAIGRTIIQDVLRDLSPIKAHAIRSVVGHYIAGTTGEKELDQSLKELAE